MGWLSKHNIMIWDVKSVLSMASTSPTAGIPALGKGGGEPQYEHWSSGTASAFFTNANKNRPPGTADGTPRHAWALAAFCQQFYVISKDHSFLFECSKTLLIEESQVSLDSLLVF